MKITKKRLLLGSGALIVLALFALYAFEPLFTIFQTWTPQAIREFVHSFGAWAPVVFIVAQIMQAIIAPIPSEGITIAGGFIFGKWVGIIYSFIGEFIGAALCFMLARWFGRGVVEKIIKKADLEAADNFFETKKGAWAIFIARLTPIISFDVVSYASGLTSMSFGNYMIATTLGMIPRIALLTWLGHKTSGSLLWMFLAMFLIVLALIILMPLLAKYQNKKKKVSKKNETIHHHHHTHKRAKQKTKK